ncbi:klaroid protein isoform X2 [Toxorhynchites rutilus septentrionalis]|uniref:klaroid protein isoform X2 n=1 Tax=Toxorhynchites rutilus septentrionalis TaxID=329112 RepID=UPI00247A3EA4|nr:klaroid protein isoform X2 [Toxorhynchites rutilus septentrionalis]
MEQQQESTERAENRARSRSKTPAIILRVSAEREINGGGEKAATQVAADKKVKKVSTITTIVEENSSSQTITTESSPSSRVTRQVRTITSDYSSDGISPEKASSKQSANFVATTTTITTSSKTVTPPSSKTIQESITSIRRTPEIQQNELNEVLEDRQTTATIRTSTPKITYKTQKKMNLTTEELREHAAYKEYREAGEYWNKYPKTDYTYSELSPHRREIIPGVIAMPNMSRPGLNKHTERVNVMIQQNPTQEKYIRKRYSSAKYAAAGVSGGSFAHADPYDSGEDPVDWSQIYKSPRRHMSNDSYRKMAMAQEEQKRSIVSRVFLTIVHFFYSTVHSVSRVFNRSEHNLYYTRVEEERGFFSKIYSLFTTLVTNIFKNVYLVISKILFLDTWLLQTSVSDAKRGRRKRKFLLLLLTLLPFLLFGAFLLADEEQTIVLPASKRATIALSSLAHILPPLSAEEFDNLRRSFLRKLDWRPDPQFSWSSLLPTFVSSSGGSVDSPSAQYESLRSNLQKTLSPEEYDDLMRHIDEYIEGLLAERFLMREKEAASVPNEMSPEMAVHVANVVQQNLKSFNYEIGSAQVDRVAEQVKQELLANYPHVFKPTEQGNSEAFVLSKENIAEIQLLIKSQIDGINVAIDDQQLEDVVVKVLSSKKLVDIIDSRVLLKTKESMNSYETQAALIDNLKNEITEIKVHFTEKLAARSLVLEDNLKLLRQDHASLSDKMNSYRIENDEKYLKLLADIDVRLAAVQREQFAGLNNIIKKNIVTILGLNVAENFTDEDIKTWISNLFVAKDYLENRLKEYQVGVNALIQKELERSAATLMKEIGDKIQKEVLIMLQSQKSELNIDAQAGKTTSSDGSGGLSEVDVRRIVRDALRIYDADKTGLVDYALESAGGQILSTRCTENYQTQSAQISIFGIPLWYPTNTPRTVISPTMQPGQCWAFTGFPGYLGSRSRKRRRTGFAGELRVPGQ